MSFLVAIEGADGAGKNTAAMGLRAALESQGISARVISFPRYSDTVGGFALGEFLSGRLPVPTTPQAAAVLYALDRMESVPIISAAGAANDVVIFDRYIASNMVYQASKVPEQEAYELMDWIWRLEVETFRVPPPDLSIYLDTSLEHAQELMHLKERRSYTERTLDEHEADLGLQERVRANYAAVAEKGGFGEWRVVRSATTQGLRPPEQIVEEIVALLKPLFKETGYRRERRLIA